MKRLIIILLILSSVQLYVTGQDITQFKCDPALFLGKWTATSEGTTYELTMTRDTIYFSDFHPDYNDVMEEINCRLIYKKNGTIVRTIEPDGALSMLGGVPASERLLFLSFFDKERKINGRVRFELAGTGNNTASWELTRTEGVRVLQPGEEVPTFDIPRHLTFRKVVNADLDKPGGGLDPGFQM